ncbi:hypothetical protein Taro_053982 [Colocasia esculenta]|uniref:Dirigent protein n=1 Tax=Colocasia esculenta TaxID=4460 RepID=A0A843XP52_COLES|nr:hypothetical protein [Colocasia esculenta]
MASFLPIPAKITTTTTVAASSLIFFTASLLLCLAANAQDGFNFGQEKKTHLHFFFHDILSGTNPTAVRLDTSAGRSLASFGDIVMIDDALTEGADPSSKLIGRAQGFYAGASKEETALLMTMNYHFVTGDYNGSTLAILARNRVMSETREMSVVGGTGYFRLARGYALAKTQSFNMFGDAVVEYNASMASSPGTPFLFSFVVALLVLAVRAQDGFDFGPEKQTRLHFFFHDVLNGPNPTAVRIAQAPTTNTSSNGFGMVMMIDDALTEGPDPSSKLLGRAQGMYAQASQGETALLMALNYHFVDGDYNGSTLAVLGRNSVFSATREMAVVGGTGYFRLARGYAVAKTHTLEVSTGNAVVEYDVYVVHQGPQGSGTGSGSRVNNSPSSSTGSRSVVHLPVLLLLQALSLFYL